MKHISKSLRIIMILIAVFLSGVGVRLLTQSTSPGTLAEEQPVFAANNISPLLEQIATVPKEATQSPANPDLSQLDAATDIKRGSFFSTDVTEQLSEFAAEQTIHNVWLGTSRILHSDTRAFVKVCMAQQDSSERLEFGSARIEFPSGKSENFFVHNDIPNERNASCQILEFVGVPQGESGDSWRFVMEWVGYTAPNEGEECLTYQKRADSSPVLQQAGINIFCTSTTGVTDIQVRNQPSEMSQEQVQQYINEAIFGVQSGPWSFNLPVLYQ